MTAAVSSTQWLIGWVIGFAVVLVVAVVVLVIIALAARIKHQLADILAALTDARDNTVALWEVQTTNRVAEDIVDSASKLRKALGG